MNSIDVTLNLTDDVLKYLQQEAETRQVTLEQVVSDVLADYFDDPSAEDILSGVKRSMQQVLSGDYRPARAVLDEIEREAIDDADQS